MFGGVFGLGGQIQSVSCVELDWDVFACSCFLLFGTFWDHPFRCGLSASASRAASV